MIRSPLAFALALFVVPDASAHAQNVPVAPTPAHVAFVDFILDSADAPGTVSIAPVFEVDEFTRRATEGLATTPAITNGLRTGLARGIDFSFAPILASKGEFTIRDMGRYRRGAIDVLRFRLIFDRGGFEIVEFAVRSGPNGVLRFYDRYSMSAGEWASATVRREFETLLLGQVAITPRIRAMQEIVALRNEGRLREALDRILAMPVEQRRDKTMLLLWVGCAMDGGTDDEYVAALNESIRALGDDPMAMVQAIDLAFLTRQWDRGLSALDKLEREFGADAYFDVMRANLAVSAGTPEVARRHAEAAVSREPTFALAHECVLDIYVRLARPADAVRAIRALEGLGMRYEGFDPIDADYDRFVRSPEYAAWLRTRAVD